MKSESSVISGFHFQFPSTVIAGSMHELQIYVSLHFRCSDLVCCESSGGGGGVAGTRKIDTWAPNGPTKTGPTGTGRQKHMHIMNGWTRRRRNGCQKYIASLHPLPARTRGLMWKRDEDGMIEPVWRERKLSVRDRGKSGGKTLAERREPNCKT